MKVKFTQEDFIKKAIYIHGKKYNYNKVKYINAKTKVTIQCPIHGDFEQIPDVHLRSGGCYKCGRMNTGEKLRKGNEQFIIDSNIIHNNKYSYDKVDYINANTKVIITCPEHGDFFKTPAKHIMLKQGCQKCIKLNEDGSQKINLLASDTINFILKANKKHNSKYTYLKTNYINIKTKVIITCPEHGDFEQSPSNHLHGFGCSSCGGNFRYDTNSFIEKCNKIHSNKFSYEKTVYTKVNKKVIITCPIHGDFEQLASSHLNGSGCLECSGKKQLDNKTFIDRSSLIHNNKYSYDKVIYKNYKSKVIITCPIHGDFEQTPDKHLYGNGCLKCSGSEKSNTHDFINKSIKIHGSKYTYDKVNYQTAHKLVIITCPEHGDFKITPNSHLNGRGGCVKCSNGGGYKKEKKGYFYIHSIENNNGNIEFYKFGITNRPIKRLTELKNKNLYKMKTFKLFVSINGDEIYQLEKHIKLSSIQRKVISKNIMKDGYTETIKHEDYNKLMSIINNFINDNDFKIQEIKYNT